MGKIKINIYAVLSANSKAQKAKNKIHNTCGVINTVSCELDKKILSRSNIDGKLISIKKSLSKTEKQVGEIITVVENGADSYHKTEVKLINMEQQIKRKF